MLLDTTMIGADYMILVDNRVGSKELLLYFQKIGTKVELTSLEYGDFCFEGNGPNGKVCIGVERKTVGDLLNCVDDARYSAHQLPGMNSMYNKSILIVEGVWKPDTVTGYLMECVATLTWRPFRQRSQMIRYSKLFRYMLSVQLAGVAVLTSRDQEQTAYNVFEVFSYFQKKWEDHTSLLEMQKLNLPSLNGKPSLVQRWAGEIQGIGVKHSQDATKMFKTAYDLAKSEEADWMGLPGVGAKTARSIIRQIHGEE
jgi:ERCC4-type nuclease